MATTKTIQPTGTTITIPAMTDRPDASVFSTDVSRIVDAVNAVVSTADSLALRTPAEHFLAENTNLDNLKTPGMYYCNNVATTGKPADQSSAAYYHLMVVGLVNTVIQIYFDFGASMYVRSLYGNTVGSWKKVTTTTVS